MIDIKFVLVLFFGRLRIIFLHIKNSVLGTEEENFAPKMEGYCTTTTKLRKIKSYRTLTFLKIRNVAARVSTR